MPIFILFILVSCTVPLYPDTAPEWQYTDLKAIDPADATVPEMDIIAVFTRKMGDEYQIRLDMLELGDTINHDLYLLLDTKHGGSHRLPVNSSIDMQWEVMISIPASGGIQVFSPELDDSKGWGIRVTRDPIQDNLQISINRTALNGYESAPWANMNLKLQAFTTPTESTSVADRTDPISSNAISPLPAKVLFAFWNTLPAYSPSMALRKWDGAHTGPLGGRHGLFNLLRTASSNDIPLVLLDLNYPPVLSALEFFGGMDLVHDMDKRNLLTLPQALPDSRYSPLSANQDMQYDLLANNKIVGKEFGINSSHSIYSPDGIIPNITAGQTLFLIIDPQPNDHNRFQFPIIKHRQSSLIPIPNNLGGDEDQQATLQGLSIDIKRSLIQAANNKNYSHNPELARIVLLGGNLPDSTWGVPEMARAAFQYINAHPWIHPINPHELNSLPHSSSYSITNLGVAKSGYPSEFKDNPNSVIMNALINLPHNLLGKAAWDTYWAFFNPVYPYHPELVDLRSKYIPQLLVLIEAAKWSINPYRKITCSFDIDFDGEAECLLASETSFTVIEPVGGYISFMFFQNMNGPHQIIGPSSQFITGTSDPIFWDLSGGIQADPRVIHGAFEDPDVIFEIEINSDGISLIDPANLISKHFELKPTGLTFEFQLDPNLKHYTTDIPVVIDPWQMYGKDWEEGYGFSAAPNEVSWDFDLASPFVIRTTGNMTVASFLQSREYFSAPENPNLDYPTGHFLPFPVSLVTISNPTNFSVDFIFNDK